MLCIVYVLLNLFVKDFLHALYKIFPLQISQLKRYFTKLASKKNEEQILNLSVGSIFFFYLTPYLQVCLNFCVTLILLERQLLYKNVLYQIAFRYDTPENERTAAKAEIVKRFGKIESASRQKISNYFSFGCTEITITITYIDRTYYA